uniref:HMA domain-containing protein n=1 Tax=Picea sitchensis TaxID=3332 RepID=D5AD09_PICSI|nr:unknown [Picea sitchensis]
MDALGCISSFFSGQTKRSKRKFQTVEMKVRMDCEGCERKVKKSVSSMKGVESVDVNRKEQKLTVTGYVDVNKVVKKVKGTGKRAELWPYVPYDLVYHPYSAQSYDKKAPSGYVRNVESSFLSPPNRTDERYTTLFSEDNANSCTIM